MDFIIRIHKPHSNTYLADITNITISNITILSKYNKHQIPTLNTTNSSKFKYSATIRGKLLKTGGSINYPCITFKGNHIDILIKNFPRFPVFTQEYHIARNCLNGYGYIGHINNGFPKWENYRKIEIIPL